MSLMTQKKVDDYPDFDTVAPIVEQFIAETGYVSWFNDGLEDRWGSPHYQISWSNRHGYSCSLYVIYTWPEQITVRCLCWGIHKLLGGKNWPVIKINHVGADLHSTMNGAVEWAEGFQQEV